MGVLNLQTENYCSVSTPPDLPPKKKKVNQDVERYKEEILSFYSLDQFKAFQLVSKEFTCVSEDGALQCMFKPNFVTFTTENLADIKKMLLLEVSPDDRRQVKSFVTGLETRRSKNVYVRSNSKQEHFTFALPFLQKAAQFFKVFFYL